MKCPDGLDDNYTLSVSDPPSSAVMNLVGNSLSQRSEQKLKTSKGPIKVLKL